MNTARALVDERVLEHEAAAVAAAREVVLTRRAQAEAFEQEWKRCEQDRRALAELESRARTAHGIELAALENAEMDEIAGMRSARERARAAKNSEKRSSLATSPVDEGAAD
ncbi:MAG TPA: hypothetical protein ENJ09_16215 [Planctomycetes bacterium]|nr:hypothetical protein [Planctomycetota bacterium]